MKKLRAIFVQLLAGMLAWGVAAPAAAAPTASSVQATVNGQTGTGGATESVTFSGKALITARVMEDPDFRTPPIVVLTVDLSGVSGVGATSKKKYVTTDKAIVQRRLRPSDSVAISFPYWVSGTTATGTGPVGTMSITLTYNVDTK